MKPKIIISIITLFLVISACNTPAENTKNENDPKELFEAERKLLEQEKKLLEQEKINLEDKKIAIEEEAKLKENNRALKSRIDLNQEHENNRNYVYSGNAESVISNFLDAENSRNFESIYSFYSPYLRRYFGHNNPTYSSLQNVYRKAWNSTPYSKNTLLSIDQINENEFIVKINYAWSKNSDASYINNKFDNLKFVLDNENKIIEVSSLN